MTLNTSQPSPYSRGARDGLTFGIYLTVMFFASIYTTRVAMLSLLSIAMMLAVPFVIYYYLRRGYVADRGRAQMSALWIHGIMIFLCGSLLAGAVEVIWLRWIDKTYVVDQIHAVIDLYSNSGWDRGEEMAKLLQSMIDNNVIPSTISIVMEMIWLSVFSGSLLSALLALLVKARPLRHPSSSSDSDL
ncbi:MAG: DUF4199 domain-containing protein [Bacteroides sp.]|nr:DUF4199 domain-containing protein [Bacteroides sp.]